MTDFRSANKKPISSQLPDGTFPSFRHVCSRIMLDVSLSIATVIGDGWRVEIDIVTDDSRMPRR